MHKIKNCRENNSFSFNLNLKNSIGDKNQRHLDLFRQVESQILES